MSLTLGEKLRQAREARGITLSEVAEQTRIAPLYIESIENDDYRGLPGGIFNKGFVKSFAKYVGVDEQEALQDYATLAANQVNQIVDEPRTYRPEVLTDERSSASSIPTIIFAVIILGLMTGGILFLVKYLQNNPATSSTETANTATESNANLNVLPNANVATTPIQSAPTMNDLKVEIKSVNAPVSIFWTSDGKPANRLLKPDDTINVEPKDKLKFSYYKSLAPNVQLSLNGKQIALPQAPATPKRNTIEIEINKDNIASIWQNGKVSFDATSAP